MVRTLKVSVERKTFWVRVEGEVGGNWCSITEHSKGSVFVLGLEKEKVSWLIKQLTKAIEMKICMGFNQKFRGKTRVHLLEVCFNVHGREGRAGKEGLCTKNAGPLQRSYAKVVRDEGPRKGGLVPVGRWARAVVCECQDGAVNWVEGRPGHGKKARAQRRGDNRPIRRRKKDCFL
ncbi:hypothetical protein CK203_101066 [Vitis vinifera]|uniref:Uncharacterized protein n=1 Tax=Vitis vinifera TaxID=29760 RepID=A0A438CRH6_VITVI|nr:hypothetical protein CK203_101066 [Vitis vinifera]